MIAFGCAIEDVEAFERYAANGIERAREPDSELHLVGAMRNRARSWNLLLDLAARAGDQLEGLVLVHPHCELLDEGLLAKLREAFADGSIAIAGCAGACGVRSLAWWDGAVVSADVRLRYQEHGGGEVQRWEVFNPRSAPAEVEAIDPCAVFLSPWAVNNLRFDEGLENSVGCELDLCLQARAQGKRVVVVKTSVAFYGGLKFVEEGDPAWIRAHIQLAEKWEGQLGFGRTEPADWRERAWLAEAEREAARSAAHTRLLHVNAAARPLEQERDRIYGSLSWRLTEPLRRLNTRRRQRRERQAKRRPPLRGASRGKAG
ncbi:hypothetical protein [Thermoleophilum album]|uniref:Uncharacterized protein n=1 Tax=Thermoleophilum album TaxID=29539 RepID=A0A1H6FJD8_THEAL|nr:hypothetical protein [Thermoleophilum album]SEH10268.1 hypothetical protein SAMN02745716_0117 [Thermoleophilum album]